MSDIQNQFPHYFKDVRHLDYIDVYMIGELYEITDNALFHAIKKLLAAGQRGAKDTHTDVNEAIITLNRWKDIQEELRTKQTD